MTEPLPNQNSIYNEYGLPEWSESCLGDAENGSLPFYHTYRNQLNCIYRGTFHFDPDLQGIFLEVAKKIEKSHQKKSQGFPQSLVTLAADLRSAVLLAREEQTEISNINTKILMCHCSSKKQTYKSSPQKPAYEIIQDRACYYLGISTQEIQVLIRNSSIPIYTRIRVESDDDLDDGYHHKYEIADRNGDLDPTKTCITLHDINAYVDQLKAGHAQVRSGAAIIGESDESVSMELPGNSNSTSTLPAGHFAERIEGVLDSSGDDDFTTESSPNLDSFYLEFDLPIWSDEILKDYVKLTRFVEEYEKFLLSLRSGERGDEPLEGIGVIADQIARSLEGVVPTLVLEDGSPEHCNEIADNLCAKMRGVIRVAKLVHKDVPTIIAKMLMRKRVPSFDDKKIRIFEAARILGLEESEVMCLARANMIGRKKEDDDSFQFTNIGLRNFIDNEQNKFIEQHLPERISSIDLGDNYDDDEEDDTISRIDEDDGIPLTDEDIFVAEESDFLPDAEVGEIFGSKEEKKSTTPETTVEKRPEGETSGAPVVVAAASAAGASGEENNNKKPAPKSAPTTFARPHKPQKLQYQVKRAIQKRLHGGGIFGWGMNTLEGNQPVPAPAVAAPAPKPSENPVDHTKAKGAEVGDKGHKDPHAEGKKEDHKNEKKDAHGHADKADPKKDHAKKPEDAKKHAH